MSYWWVNHKQTWEHEVRGGYLWSPLRKRNDGFNQTYENMRYAKPGDIVFSYAFARIGAVGIVTEAALPSPKPDEFGGVGNNWSDEGWLVEVEFVELKRPLSPQAHITAIGPLLPELHSPIQRNGRGNQGVYLASISPALGQLLMALTQADHIPAFQGISDILTGKRATIEQSMRVLQDIDRIRADTEVPETQREHLARARVGQGLFRKRVLRLDRECRVTGVSDSRVLVASHIKPWRLASNEERLSGLNGVLLSPHVDALFDDQLITFEDDGRMHVHPSLPDDVLERWSIDPSKPVESFRTEQRAFLEFHRKMFGEKTR